MANRFKSGYYTPKFPSKYAGNPFKIKYRSSWELKFMEYCDNNTHIVNWVSETLFIPYYLDGKLHRYFPDFLIKARTLSGTDESFLIEVKPKAQTIPPKQPVDVTDRKKLTRYYEQLEVFKKNTAKWEAAKIWANIRGITFILVTEAELFEKFK